MIDIKAMLDPREERNRERFATALTGPVAKVPPTVAPISGEVRFVVGAAAHGIEPELFYRMLLLIKELVVNLTP